MYKLEGKKKKYDFKNSDASTSRTVESDLGRWKSEKVFWMGQMLREEEMWIEIGERN